MQVTNTSRPVRHSKRHRWFIYLQLLEECDRLAGVRPLKLMDTVRLSYFQMDGFLRTLYEKKFLEILEYEMKKSPQQDFQPTKTLRTTQKGRQLAEWIRKLFELIE